MRYLALFLVVFPYVAHSLPSAQKMGNICHAENAQYNYGGLWELSLRGKLICNYWQFLGDDERKKIELQLDEYGEFPIWNTSEQISEQIIEDDEYPQYWEVEDWEDSDWDTESENEDTEATTEE